MRTVHVILLSGGVGERMAADRPKQFLPVAGRPALLRALDAFLGWKRLNGRLALVAPSAFLDETTRMVQEAYPDRLFPVVPGGETRHASTLAGLAALGVTPGGTDLAADDAIYIHDAARPLIETDELERLRELFATNPSVRIASLAGPVSETVVEASGLPGAMERSADRSRLFAIKTPQAARVGMFIELLRRNAAATAEYTDLLTWGEAVGVQGYLVEAGPRNVKLTRPEDLIFVEALLSHSLAEART